MKMLKEKLTRTRKRPRGHDIRSAEQKIYFVGVVVFKKRFKEKVDTNVYAYVRP
jgi:hypothetical protein